MPQVLQGLGRDRVEARHQPDAVGEDRLRLLRGRSVPGPHHLPGPTADGGRERRRRVAHHAARRHVVLDGPVDVCLPRVRDRDEHQLRARRGGLVGRAVDRGVAAEHLPRPFRGLHATLLGARPDHDVVSGPGESERDPEPLVAGAPHHRDVHER